MKRLPFIAVAGAFAVFAASAAAAPDRTKPTTPGNLRVTGTTSTSVSLAWNASTDNSGSVTYRVREAAGAQYAVAQTSTTVTNLVGGRTYTFTVIAVDAAGNQSSASSKVSATTPLAPPPAGLRVTATTAGSVSLAWNSSGPGVTYQVRRDGWDWQTTTATTATFNMLAAGTTYRFDVRVQGSATWSAPVSATTVADTSAPTEPAGVTTTVLSPSMVRVTWNASSDDTGAVNYNLYLDGGNWKHMMPAGTRTVDVGNLRAGRTYDIAVAAYDGSGNFSSRAHASVTTAASADTTPPRTPPGFTHGFLYPHIVPLRWGWWPDDFDVFAYEIHMDGRFLAEVLGDVRYGGMLIPGYTARHLAPGSTHTFTLYGRDEAGNLSAPSAPITVTTPPSDDTTPPGRPAVDWGDTAPGCAFANIAYHGTGAPEDGDVEFFEDGEFLDVDRGEVPETSFGRHVYTAKAVDRAGNASAASNPLTLDFGWIC